MTDSIDGTPPVMSLQRYVDGVEFDRQVVTHLQRCI